MVDRFGAGISAANDAYLLQFGRGERLGHAALEKTAQIVQQVVLHGDEEERGRGVHEGEEKLARRERLHSLRHERERERGKDDRREAWRTKRRTQTGERDRRRQRDPGLGPDTSQERASQGLLRRQ